MIGRGKKSVTLNLRSPEGQQIARDLIAGADIVVENFRPGTLEKWGLGYEALSAANPGLIMARVGVTKGRKTAVPFGVSQLAQDAASAEDLVQETLIAMHTRRATYDTNLPFAGIYDANHRFDSGILLHGKNNTLKDSTLQLSAGNGVNLKGSGHTVTNTLIHDVSYGGTYTAAVTIEVG